jgi:hypothetical protein
MHKQIFNNVGAQDSAWIVKEYFNAIYLQGRFLWALPLLIDKRGCVVNEVYCLFPDPSDPDPACHFEGVMFGIADDETIVTEEACSIYIKEACKNYLGLHPRDEGQIREILGSSPL